MKKIYTAKHIDRIRVIQSYISGQYSRKMAAMTLGVTERQVTRIVSRYIQDGPESVIHGNTGKTAMNKLPKNFRQQIVSLYNDKYGKNGVKLNFCHFQDKLRYEEKIVVPYSTLRRIMIESNIQPPEARVVRCISLPRPRRIFAGELVQVDASIHRWLYKDFHLYALHGAIDDATGIITGLWLEKTENMHGYQMVLLQTMQSYGKPKCFYTDNRNMFETTRKKTTKSKLGSPRFKTLLTHLGIDIITTSNPRAKGRIERIWRTLQSRLYNELQLRQISTIEEANAFIQEYLPILNRAFASDVNPNRNAFETIPADYDYNRNLALFKEVSIHGGCYVVIGGHYYTIREQTSQTPILAHKAWLYQFLDGSYHIKVDEEWYDLKDIGPRSAHQDLISMERTYAGRQNKTTPWRQFNPNFLKRKCPANNKK